MKCVDEGAASTKGSSPTEREGRKPAVGGARRPRVTRFQADALRGSHAFARTAARTSDFSSAWAVAGEGAKSVRVQQSGGEAADVRAVGDAAQRPQSEQRCS